MQTLQTLFSKNTDAAQTLQKITAFAHEGIMAAMNLNPLVCLFYFFFEVCVFETPHKQLLTSGWNTIPLLGYSQQYFTGTHLYT